MPIPAEPPETQALAAADMPAPADARHVVVIGAGIVGACCALAARREGFRVTVLEPGVAGAEQAASFGNGAWLNPGSVIPPATPGIWRRVPGWLRDPLGPLAVRWRYFPRVAPWLARYLWSGWTEAKVMRTAQALAGLLEDCPGLHQALAQSAGVGHLIEQRGLINIFPDRAAFEAEAMAWRIRRSVGVRWLELPEEELRQREPELDRRYRFAVITEAGGNCRDPGRYVAALLAQAEAEGVAVRRLPALGFAVQNGRLQAVHTAAGPLQCDRAVIAAGIHSRTLAAAAGTTVPLESERGYHAAIGPFAPAADGSGNKCDLRPLIRTPLMPSDGKMALSPTDTGLRAAGQVEIAGLHAAPNWRRAEILRDQLLRSIPGLPKNLPAESVRFWMGHRPSMPDGLPCIGPTRASGDILCAFGHGHVGLAGGPRTAEVITALLAGRNPSLDVTPFSPNRF